jgi:hypothetical protein
VSTTQAEGVVCVWRTYVLEHDDELNVWRVRIPSMGLRPELVLQADSPLRLLADMEAFTAELNQAWLELAVRSGLLKVE